MNNTIIQLLISELEMEAVTTRKFLNIVPNDQLDWQPHTKSMSIRAVATHVAEIPSWISLGIKTEELDMAAQPYMPAAITNNQDLLDIFEKGIAQAIADLKETSDELILNGTWVMRAGEHVIIKLSKYETIRHGFSQLIHHRAQLGVDLRLLNIPIPGSYGPSADEMGN